MTAVPVRNCCQSLICALAFCAATLISCTQDALSQEANPPFSIADLESYLLPVSEQLQKDWPGNQTVNIVCHGHSVPAGYFTTPEVHSLEAYPHFLRVGLAEKYPHAVINVIVTAVGGETSEAGAKRFAQEVLNHRPNVITIDYGLNDRGIGLERARKAWQTMIEQSQSRNVKVILLTPTADESANLNDPRDTLCQHAQQIRELAGEYHTGLVDSLVAFQDYVNAGKPLSGLMSQGNHPNRAGHELVADRLLEWFPKRIVAAEQQ